MTNIIKKLKIKPYAIYNNSLDIKKNLNNFKNIKGIYLWYNNINNKFYIGSSINLYNRLYTYFSLKILSNNNMLIYKALLKYGYENFSLMIIEIISNNKNINILEREQYYFNLLNPTYNILKNSHNSTGFKHSPETIEKMKNNTNSKNQIMSDTAKKQISEYQKNRHKNLTEEERKNIALKISTSKKNNNFKHNSETIEKIRNTLLNKTPYNVYDLKGNLILKFQNKIEIGKYFNISGNTIRTYYLNKDKIFKEKYYIKSI